MRPVWLVIAGLVCLACSAPVVPQHVLLISIDTLRADHLGSYGYQRPTSPNLDALAAESVVFENAWATAPWTLPSHGSLMTGLYPSHHGARRERDRLSPEVGTLAESLREGGLATGAVVNVLFLAKRYGFDRGFDLHRRVKESSAPGGDADRVGALGLDWLREQTGPSFLFLHYFDVHSDYVALPRFVKMFAPPGGRLRGTTDELMAIQGGTRAADARDIAQLEALYDAGIRQLDEALGRLFAELRAEGRWDDTLLVVTSDHGEEFRDHGGVVHGFTHYEEMLRVPLIVRVPGGPSGVRIADPVSLVDVAPTILSALGLEVPPGLDGVDLTSRWRGGRGERERRLHAETGPKMRDEIRSVRAGSFKLIVDRARDRRELFDLAADPAERRDVADEHPDVAARLLASIEQLEREAVAASEPVRLTPRLIQRLRALGYEAGASPP